MPGFPVLHYFPEFTQTHVHLVGDAIQPSHPLLSPFLPAACGCSDTKLCPTLSDSMNCSMPGFPVLHYLPEFIQNHVHGVNDAIQPSHLLLLPSSPPALNLS